MIEDLLSNIQHGTDALNGLDDSLSQSNEELLKKIKGKAFGIITASVLKEVLQEQLKGQIIKKGPYNIISQSIKTVNDNLSATALIIRKILQIQIITIAGVLKNTQVETKRAQRIAALAKKLKSSDVDLKDLFNYAIELDEYTESLQISLSNLENKIAQTKDSAHLELVKVQDKLILYISSEKIKALNEAHEALLKAHDELNQQIDSSKSEALKRAHDELAKTEEKILQSINSACEKALNKAHEDLSVATDNLQREIDSAKSEAIEQAGNKLDAARQDIHQHIEVSKNEAMNKAHYELECAIDNIHQHIDSTRDSILSKTHAELLDVQDRLHQQIESVREDVIMDMRHHLDQAQETLTTLIARGLEKTNTELNNVAETLASAINKSEENTSRLIAELGEKLESSYSLSRSQNRKRLIGAYVLAALGVACSVALLVLSMLGII